MGRTILFAAVSLDGYVAQRDDSVGPLFDWYGNGDVSVTAGDVGGQALQAGLVDQVALNPVPVVLGSGRPFLGSGGPVEVLLEDPRVVEGRRVTHLLYDVRR